MRNEVVPEMQVKVRVATAETGDEVILVGLDGAFGSVGVMQVRRNKLEINARIAQKCFETAGAFIVKHLVLRGEAAGGKVGVQDASGSDEFAFVTRGEWFRQDSVTVMVVQDHEVLATAGRVDRKTSGLVSAYFSSDLNYM